ncbi:MAG TPA: GNAT family N-acetyltransferase [Bacteroidia bacterium]|nr:GNAT family N-acetyltransferase [Bacteroidia bacterium]HNP97705.1 GNAT family N-acetyltransferase [Bacteroidia bacterium]
MLKLVRTDSSNQDFQNLVKALDSELKQRDGEEHTFFAQFNKIDLIRHVVVAYQNNEVVGCGAMKEYTSGAMEIKRMFVPFEQRGKGIAGNVLDELEKWAQELGYSKCILETGLKQPEAIRLYEKNKYLRIANYGQYEKVSSSVCFEKILPTR